MPSRPKRTQNDPGLGGGSQSGKGLLCQAEVPSLINGTIYKQGVVFTKPALGSPERVDLLVPLSPLDTFQF